MTVDARQKGHFARIAAAKKSEHEERMREAHAEPAMKKILDGLEMGLAAPDDAASDAMRERRTRGQAELHARARRLGMIR